MNNNKNKATLAALRKKEMQGLQMVGHQHNVDHAFNSHHNA